MKKADIHCHLWRGADALSELASACRKNSIEKICLSSTGRQHGQASNNEVIDAYRKEPDLVIPMAWIHLDRETSADIHCYAEAGFRGLKVIDPLLPYNHPNYMPVYSAAAELGMPVLFHCGVKARFDGGTTTVNENHRPIWLDDIARRYPPLKLVLAHIGTPWRDEAFMVCRVNPNVFIEFTSGSGWERKGLGPEYFEQRLWWEGAWDKVLFGTDVTPDRIGWAVEVYEKILNNIAIGDQIREDVFYNNCMSLWE